MAYIKRQNIELAGNMSESVIKTIIAFANTNGGKLYIGIEDDGSITGVENIDYTISNIKKAIENNIKPNMISFIDFTLKIIDKKNVILAEVQKGVSRPYFIKSESITPHGVYIRENSHTVPAALQSIIKMLDETGEGNFESTVSIEQNLSFDYISKKFGEITAENIKANYLINNNDLYTNLGLLLSDQCQHTIKLAVFKNEKNTNSEDIYEFKGSILEQFDLAYSFIDSYNETSDNPLYSMEIIKEALLNSICHRDYLIKASVMINIFYDRIEILNPGGLYEGINKNDIKAGLSILRNERLSKIFCDLNLMDACGRGFSKIKNCYDNFALKHEIIVTENTFKIILPNISEQQSVYISENETKVIEFAENISPFTRQELCDKLNLTKSTAISILKKLTDKNLIFKEGNGKNTAYYLKT